MASGVPNAAMPALPEANNNCLEYIDKSIHYMGFFRFIENIFVDFLEKGANHQDRVADSAERRGYRDLDKIDRLREQADRKREMANAIHEKRKEREQFEQ